MEKIQNVKIEEALRRLKAGNLAYRNSTKNASIITNADRQYHVDNGQHPFACIVCCSDSRVVPEHIFSVGIGDLFTIRTAGNVIGQHELGSIEYAVDHLHVPFVVVMGHTHCGAVASAVDGHVEGYTKVITDQIKETIQDPSNLRQCEWDNAKEGVKRLLNVPSLHKRVHQNELLIVAAMYDTETGEVTL